MRARRAAQEESDAYYSFQGLMQRLGRLVPIESLGARVGRFIMLFKTLFPEVNAALEEEEVRALGRRPRALQPEEGGEREPGCVQSHGGRGGGARLG